MQALQDQRTAGYPTTDTYRAGEATGYAGGWDPYGYGADTQTRMLMSQAPAATSYMMMDPSLGYGGWNHMRSVVRTELHVVQPKILANAHDWDAAQLALRRPAEGVPFHSPDKVAVGYEAVGPEQSR
eukprot:Gregarina_sp_Poly_1__3015@NODE_1847_length_3213_cov_87_893516_g1199_i0_p3_GENE_NODE_1847_length_3213_cov_87_893516_g1199_i0NODE_1847_length_3213_cov_87_893516_g1199_i0_p3_ORF_typecomplete_len127_score11_02_NODE_1847_length_3213_cov_87_893516_g1199_i011691549